MPLPSRRIPTTIYNQHKLGEINYKYLELPANFTESEIDELSNWLEEFDFQLINNPFDTDNIDTTIYIK